MANEAKEEAVAATQAAAAAVKNIADEAGSVEEAKAAVETAKEAIQTAQGMGVSESTVHTLLEAVKALDKKVDALSNQTKVKKWFPL